MRVIGTVLGSLPPQQLWGWSSFWVPQMGLEMGPGHPARREASGHLQREAGLEDSLGSRGPLGPSGPFLCPEPWLGVLSPPGAACSLCKEPVRC